MKYSLRILIVGLLSAASMVTALAEVPENLFLAPPAAAKPHVHWHWMSGNVTQEGITADLEAMHRIGIGGVQIYNASPSIPRGPVKFMSPEWRKLTRFAMQEAQRLGMEVGIHNCAGWSSSGGPWMTVEDSMKELTWSETRIEGGKLFDGLLAAPFRRKDFYRDEVLIAVPTSVTDTVRMADLSPKIRTSLKGVNIESVIDGDLLTVITAPAPSPESPAVITISLQRPLEVQTLNITPGPAFGAHGGFLEYSMDGISYTRVCDFLIPEMGNAQTYLSQGFAPVKGKVFRITFNKSDMRKTDLSMAEIEISPSFRLADWRTKSGFISSANVALDNRIPESGQTIDLKTVIDLSGKLSADGHLRWDAPPGKWTLYRFGYTTKDKFNKPYTEDGAGYECDKMSKSALETFWGGMMKAVVDDNSDLVGKSFRYVMLDSFEVGSQNYTGGFHKEFEKRMGYSMVPYMPALTGAVVESIDVTERFLWDFRRVVADMWKENYFDHLNTLAARDGLKFIGQIYGNGNFDAVEAGTGTLYPMTEFWVNKPRHTWRQMVVSSSAHLSGQSTIFAESFTAHPQDGAWKNSPGSLKTTGDLAFVDGTNAIVYHTYVHQPWVDARPGMTMGPYGAHMNRGNTWFESAGPWMDYLARSQWLLRRGLPVVDFVVFAGENSPVTSGEIFRAPGYRSEFIDRSSLQKITVDKGMLTMPEGMSYRVLIVPDNPRGLSLPVLRALCRLLHEGATIVGNKPSRTPSLQNFPESETEVSRLADEIWGSAVPPAQTARSVGKGRVITGKFTAGALANYLKLMPDCVFAGQNDANPIEFIHLRDKGAHAYFISNPTDKAMTANVAFRVIGLQPEFWDPLTGKTQPAMVFNEENGRTIIPMTLPKTGSMFVVFREPSKNGRHLVPHNLVADAAVSIAPQISNFATSVTAWGPEKWNYKFSNGKMLSLDIPAPPAPINFDSPWNVTFSEKGRSPQKFVFPKLISWPEHKDENIRYFYGTATYEIEFEVPATIKASANTVARLALGRVAVIAEVKVNDRAPRIVWAEPFTIDVTDDLVVGKNRLQVRVTNNWPNRLIGDQCAGDPRKWADRGSPAQWPEKLEANKWPDYNGNMHWTTWRHYTKDSELQTSGLIGPVKIEFGVRVPLAN